MPAKSTPSVNGGSGLSWYSPLLSSRSGKEMPDPVHLDQHLVVAGVRLVDLHQLDVGGTGGLDDLDRAHGVEASGGCS